MRRAATNALRMTLAVAAVAACGGCQIIPWLAAAFAGPEKREALCELDAPPGTVLLVLVDDLRLRETVDCAAIKRDLTIHLNEELIKNHVVDAVAGYDDVIELKITEPNFDRLSPGQIGERLNADLVLYVRIEGYSLKDNQGSPLWRGYLETSVTVCDVNGRRLWPATEQDHAVKPVEIRLEEEMSPSYAPKLTERLGAEMADRIAKLFYDHEVPAGTGAREQAEEKEILGETS